MTASKTNITINDLHQQKLRLRRRTQQLPPAGSRPVTISGKVSGWIGSESILAITDLPGVDIEDEAVHITAARRLRLSIDQVLANVAQSLAGAGLIKSWRNELLDVIGEGKCLARLERGAFRPLGLLTQAVHLNAWTQHGKLWVARRSLNKTTDPGLWDTLSGGLVGAGEDLHTALLRESYEEAGLSAVSLSKVGALRTVLRMHRRLSDGYQVENILVSDCILDAGTVPSNIDGEVMEFRCIDLSELWAMICNGTFTIEAELSILDSLEQRLDS